MSSKRAPPPPPPATFDLAPPPPVEEGEFDDAALHGLPTDQEIAAASQSRMRRVGQSATEEFGDVFAAATGNLDDIQLVDLQGDDVAPEPEREEEQKTTLPGGQAAAIAIARAEAPTKPEPRVPQAAPEPEPPAPAAEAAEAGRSGEALDLDPGGSGLELDLDLAGIPARPKAQNAPGAQAAPGASASASGAAAASTSGALAAHMSGSRPHPSPLPERIGLFGADPVLNVLLAAAIGLVIGLYPGLEAADRVERSDIAPLISELEESVDRPLAAERGEVRKPAAIAGDIEGQQARVRGRFFTFWLGAALPVALVLSLVRRKA